MSTQTLTLIEKEILISQIIKRFKTQTLQEIADETGMSMSSVRSYYVWLVRNKRISASDLKKPATPVKQVDNTTKEIIEFVTPTKHTKKRGRPTNASKGQQFKNCTIGTVNVYNNLTAEIDDTIGNYKNGNGFYKAQAKEKMQNHIIATNIQGHIGTLTNLFIDMETAIFKAMPSCYFTAVEKELPIFEQMKEKFKNSGLPITYVNDWFSKILYGKDENSYAHLIMDYCADLPTVAKELEYTVDRNLVGVGGIIALTTNKTNRNGSGEMWDYITSLSDEATINRSKDNRCKTEIENERFLYSILGRNYKILEVFSYTDTYPMTLTIIKRIK